MDLFASFDPFKLFISLSVLPPVFVFLWALIIVDFKNFRGSRKACKEFTAEDPINCYQNYDKQCESE